MRVWKFGDNIDTDAIIPGRFLTIYDPAELARHAFEGTRDEFRLNVQKGDVVVGGRNFGCGSSREHAPLSLKGAGVEVVIARSFARIFYRNAVNTGLLPIVCDQADLIADGSEIVIDLTNQVIIAGKGRLPIEPVPGFLNAIVEKGGLVEYARSLTEVPLCTESRR
ncbi:MAG: 3-isopropylmalate dehydratase small subunit [Methanoregulaceae archaeon]|nr:3-isopropylmalate dehydratase small subunit [Methanoregulaceae archaeon]